MRFVPPNWRVLSPIAACAFAIGGGDLVCADVLYDTTWMTDKGLYNSTKSGYIGGFANHGFFVDSQTADDFELADAHVITSVTGDFFTLQPGFVPADGILIEIFEDLDLVRLPHLLEELAGDLARYFLPLEGLIRLSDFSHSYLDLLEIFRRKRLIYIEIVIEPTLDRRTDRHLGAGKQILNRLPAARFPLIIDAVLLAAGSLFLIGGER